MRKILRLGFAAVAATMISTTANAQWQIPEGGTSPDWTYNDVNGDPVNLYDLLDAGYTVLLDFSATWCGPCINYHNSGVLEDVWAEHGPAGEPGVNANTTDDWYVILCESDDGTSSASFAPWLTSIHYPAIDNEAVYYDNYWGGGYSFPTLAVVCPDRVTHRAAQYTSANAWYTLFEDCEGPSTSTNDSKFTAVEYVDAICDGSSIPVKVRLQNYGSANLTTANIKVMQGATELTSYDWTGNLAPYATDFINLGNVTPTGAGTLNIVITNTDDDPSNNSFDFDVTDATVLEINGAMDIALTVNFDNYPDEFGFVFDSGTPNKTSPETQLNTTAGIGKATVGSLSGSTYNNSWNVSNYGCHYFAFVDDYGDGLLGTGSGADITGLTTLNVPGDWGDGTFVTLYLAEEGTSGVEEAVSVNSASIFPNPATDNANINLVLNQSANVSIEIYNTLGQNVFTQNYGETVGEQTFTVSTADFEDGLYIVNIKVDNDLITKRISVIK